MKKIITLFITTLLIISCKNEAQKSTLGDLKKQKSTIISKMDSLNIVLQKIEKEISKMDDNKKFQIVTVLPIKYDDFKHYVEIQGVVQADKNIEIRPELGGTVKEIYVKEGQKVKAGQILIQLDDAMIENNINELKTQLTLAETTFERQKRLWDQKIGSEMEFLRAKTQKESLENSLVTLKTQSVKMQIIAPFSGIVDEIFPRDGELTSPQMPVVRLINLNNVYVEADVTETYLPVVKVGTETVVYFSSINKEITSKIEQVGNYINPNNRSFKIRINIANKDQSIKPNLLADLKILDFQEQGAIIPSTLVQQDQKGNNYVFTVNTKNNENTVVKTIITVANEYNNEVFVSEGLTQNDTLVNVGARIVKAGDLVKITD
jgi:RND family efflux transporter MFP subunit